MGMFDTIRSSYDLGPGFRKELQTKDLDCLMYEYWIDPSGRLYEVNYDGTYDFVEVPEEKRKFKWQLFDKIYNGNHGKVSPFYYTGTIEVCPASWNAHYAPFPRCEITFVYGIIHSHKINS